MMKHLLLVALFATACTNDHNLGNTPPVLGKTRWAITLGGPQGDGASMVLFDPSGDVIAAGALGESIDFGSGAQPVAGQGMYWISRRSAMDGSEVWTREVGTALYGFVQLKALALSPDGSLIAGGHAETNADFGGASFVNRGSDAFLVKYDRNGHALWANGMTKDSHTTIESIAVGGDGRIYTSGSCNSNGIIDLPGGTIIWCSGPFLAAFDANGTMLWYRQYGQYNLDLPLVTGDDGNIYVITSITQQVTLDGAHINPTAAVSVLLAQVDPNGGFAAAGVLGDAPVARALNAVATGPDGFATACSDPMSQDPDEQVIELSTWSDTGVNVWSAVPKTGAPQIMSTAETDHGDVVSVGFAPAGGFDYGKGTVVGPMFIMAQSATGKYVEAKSYGGDQGASVRPAAVAAGPGETIAFVGSLSGTADFGAGPLVTTNPDILIGLLDPPN